jgi:AhpD family alkylhydroperoxidase
MKLDHRMQALIAVGASISASCQPCLQTAVNMALESGAGPQEIAQAIELGKRVRKGAATKMDKFISGLNEVVSTSASEIDAKCECDSFAVS